MEYYWARSNIDVDLCVQSIITSTFKMQAFEQSKHRGQTVARCNLQLHEQQATSGVQCQS